MAMRQSYIGMPSSYHGNLTETQEDLNKWCERVHRANIQLNCHANGDIAIDRTLTAYERALKLYPRANARPKITHCSQVNPELIKRMKAMYVVPSMFSTIPRRMSIIFVAAIGTSRWGALRSVRNAPVVGNAQLLS